MGRLVKPDSKEVELIFYKGQKCSSTFKLTNLMHTMSVAISLTTTNPSIFSLDKPLSIIPPLSSSPYTLQLSQPSDQPPLTRHDDLRRIFSKPGPHIFRDAVLPLSFVDPHVAEFLISHHNNNPSPESCNLYEKALSGCDKTHLAKLLKPAVELGNADSVAHQNLQHRFR